MSVSKRVLRVIAGAMVIAGLVTMIAFRHRTNLLGQIGIACAVVAFVILVILTLWQESKRGV
jgi:hypothetical protein